MDFTQLCLDLGDKKTCYNINCTTCAHHYFRMGFAKIINSHSQRDQPLEDIWDATPDDLNVLAKVSTEANLREIQRSCGSPYWLGYLGLVLYYVSEKTHQALESVPELHKCWAAQLDEMFQDKLLSGLTEHITAVISGQATLRTGDLAEFEHIESGLIQ